MAYVFLSHSHEDKPFCHKLAADLRNAGHAVWVDDAEIGIGDSLVGKITAGLAEVDFVAAVLSEASVASEWVNKELEIASNREISEKRVVVLPLLVNDVRLPGFLQGKRYGDFRTDEAYSGSFDQLLHALGPVDPPPRPADAEIELLRAELSAVREFATREAAETRRASEAAFQAKSEGLKAAIEKANVEFPSHAPINRTYAFDIDGFVVTLDYALWAVEKSMRKGMHPLEALLTIHQRWQDIRNMFEAYEEMIARQS